MFSENFTYDEASPILADQHQLALKTLELAISFYDSSSEKFCSEMQYHHDELAKNSQHIHYGPFFHALKDHTISLVELGNFQAALAWGRCFYIVSRRPSSGWLYLLSILVSAGIFSNDETTALTTVDVEQWKIPLIPKRIIQYWDKPEPPSDVSKLIKSWSSIPGYSHRLADDNFARNFINLHYGKRVLGAYEAASHVAGKADIFRLAWLYEMGGIYADADECLVDRIENLVPSQSQLVLNWSKGDVPCVNNWFIAAMPMNLFIRNALMLAIKRVENSVSSKIKSSAWLETGPGVFSMVLLDDWAASGRAVVSRGLSLETEENYRFRVTCDEFLEYRKDPKANWRLEK